ncbi:MAG: hypothetical protein H0X25_04525 [Acidobacteriales bacterium]|nr:hypothetical protein [Terriglobales bacterium]
MSTTPQSALELEAAEQRRQLHSSVEELKYHVRDTLDVRKNAHKYWKVASGAAAVLGLLAGYTFTGLFTKY